MVSASLKAQTEGSTLAYPPGGDEAAAEPPLTNDEAAKYLGYSGSWMRQSRMKGKTGPPFIRVGRSIRYRRKDLDYFQEQHLCVPGRQSPAPNNEQHYGSADQVTSTRTIAPPARKRPPAAAAPAPARAIKRPQSTARRRQQYRSSPRPS